MFYGRQSLGAQTIYRSLKRPGYVTENIIQTVIDFISHSVDT